VTYLLVLLRGGGEAHKVINAPGKATQARTARCLYVPSNADIPLSGDKVIIQMTDELSREMLYKGKLGKSQVREYTSRKTKIHYSIVLKQSFTDSIIGG
jgi:hypothetical protein